MAKKPETRENKEPKEVLGPDLKVKLTPEPVKPSKTTIERELEKVRQQLDKMDDKDTGVVSEKPPIEEGNSDSYFDIDISKLNLLDDADTKKPETDKAHEKPVSEPPEDKPEDKPEPKKTEKAEEPKDDKAHDKKHHDDDDEESESSDDNMWGRGKKKKLMK